MTGPSRFSLDRLRFLIQRLQERLWVRPLALCLLSIGGVFLAKLADGSGIERLLPEVTMASVESLLSVMASSMLTIATLAVGSMVAAYASASAAATPRSIPLVIADDVTQNALSAFVGAFIFSLVALITVKNAYFEAAGLFTVFSFTLLVFAVVILTFVRWVDRIARLGRLVNTVERVELAAAQALERRRRAPTLCAHAAPAPGPRGQRLSTTQVGYVQHLDLECLQHVAEQYGARVEVVAVPGTFVCPGQALAYVDAERTGYSEGLLSAFAIGRHRTFADDPRFGLVVLSEIAGKALSPGINDPGTAIDVIGALVRLFTQWRQPTGEREREALKHDRVWLPELSVEDLFDDAFTAIARDGAATLEVALRLRKALAMLSALGDSDMREAAVRHARLALRRAEAAMAQQEDVERLKALAVAPAGDK